MNMEVDGEEESTEVLSTPPTPEKQSNGTTTRDPFRCKLYRLGQEEAWEDLGTGFVRVDHDATPQMLVIRESSDMTKDNPDSSDVILSSKIHDADIYQLQGDPGTETIILWEEPDGHDFALSLEAEGDTKKIWKVLSGKEKKCVGACPPAKKPKQRHNAIAGVNGIRLPKPSLESLQEIATIIHRPCGFQLKETLGNLCIQEDFLSELREVFKEAEDLEINEGLNMLFHIVKGMFMLGKSQLTERLLKKDCYEDFIGMLENDEGIPLDKRFDHRKNLCVHIKFRSVLSFTDEAILDKIHLNYRLLYLKDHILPRLVDDGVSHMLSQQIYQNTSFILLHIENNIKLLDQLFSQVRDGDLQSLDFVQDCCRQMRSPGFSQQQRDTLYSTMVKRDLFTILTPFLKEKRVLAPVPDRSVPHANCRAISLDIIHMHAFHNPVNIQKYCTQNHDFLSILLGILIEEEDEGLQSLVGEITKWLMDFNVSHNIMAANSVGASLSQGEREEFLTVLYDRNGPLPTLVNFVKTKMATAEKGMGSNFAFQVICDILVTGLHRNDYQSKQFVIMSEFPKYALSVLQTDIKFLHHAVIRVIRALVKREDDQCYRYLIKNNIFSPLLDILQKSLEEQKRLEPEKLKRTYGNVIMSSILDTLNMIVTNDQKELIKHLVETHSIFKLRPSYKELEKFITKYERNREVEAFPPDAYPGGAPGRATRDSLSTQEQERQNEERYFDESDEEQEPVKDDDDGLNLEIPVLPVDLGYGDGTEDDQPGTESELESVGVGAIGNPLEDYNNENDENSDGTEAPSLPNAISTSDLSCAGSVHERPASPPSLQKRIKIDDDGKDAFSDI